MAEALDRCGFLGIFDPADAMLTLFSIATDPVYKIWTELIWTMLSYSAKKFKMFRDSYFVYNLLDKSSVFFSWAWNEVVSTSAHYPRSRDEFWSPCLLINF